MIRAHIVKRINHRGRARILGHYCPIAFITRLVIVVIRSVIFDDGGFVCHYGLDCDIAHGRAGGQCPRALCKRAMGTIHTPMDGPYP